VNQNVPALQSYRGIMPDVCNEDGLDASNTQFAAALKRLGVPHHYEVYPGNHGNRRGRGPHLACAAVLRAERRFEVIGTGNLRAGSL
jgi:hypothetical protein